MAEAIKYKEILQKNGFTFSKGLGQNFLLNPQIPRRMAEECGTDENTFVLEIGPGAGILTRELSFLSANVVSLEIDRRLIPVLEETLSGCENCEILLQDVTKTDIRELVREKSNGRKSVCCANLPYYITSPVLTQLIEAKCLKKITVMVQKEVARKICCKPGDADFGSFSVYVQYHGHPHILFDVPAGCFTPPPKVDSTVLQIDLYDAPPITVKSEKIFFKTVHAAFAMRRKTLRNCINNVFSGIIGKENVAAAFETAEIDPARRGETLTPEEFGKLSDCLFDRYPAEQKIQPVE